MKTPLIILLLFLRLTCFAPGLNEIVIPATEPLKRVYTLTEKLQAVIWCETSNGGQRYNPNEIQAVGLLQIHPIMITEVNQILGWQKYQLSDRTSDKLSVQIFMIFQNHYNKTMDFEKMCRLWCGGASGMKKASTLKYYERAKKILFNPDLFSNNNRIFDSAINYIMNQSEFITAPIADAIIPSGVVDSSSACGALYVSMMKKIKLTQGQFTKVDDDDYEYLNQFKWQALFSPSGGVWYATRTIGTTPNRKCLRMHRVIMNTPEDLIVDHIDHNGLNNQRSNLRNCTYSQNSLNKPLIAGASNYIGVHYHKWGKYEACVKQNGKTQYLGCYDTAEEAAKVRDAAAKVIHGEFANLNFKDET